jgi:3-hydroxybutyryl-CoA dehydrogenase
MHLLILGNEDLKNELLAQDSEPDLQITWISQVKELTAHTDADAILDLLFENDPERVALLKSLQRLVIINSVVHTLEETDPSFIRMNAWRSFMQGQLIEASSQNEQQRSEVEAIFKALGKTIYWVPEQPGFITPRVICSIINEAFFALEEGVSTEEEIDTAMKLGTNYPYGPFEWGSKIGLHNVSALLERLSKEQSRYMPCSLLVRAAQG